MYDFDGYKLQALAGSPAAGVVGKPVIFTGAMGEASLRDLLAEYDRLTTIPFSNTGCEPGFLGSPLAQDTVDQLNHDHTYFEISGSFRFLIWRFVRGLKFTTPQILLDILNIRAWTTSPTEHSQFGPTGWHGDAMPVSMLKIMIYLTEIGGPKGGLQIMTDQSKQLTQEIGGQAGTFVLFNNSTIRHRGVAPSLGFPPRKCVEVTVTPLPSTFSELPFPKVGGVNARHPAVPFYDITGLL